MQSDAEQGTTKRPGSECCTESWSVRVRDRDRVKDRVKDRDMDRVRVSSSLTRQLGRAS